MNFALADNGAIDPRPYPRTEAHLVAKLKGGPRGRLRVSVVDGIADASELEAVGGGMRTGAYGSAAKRLLESHGYRADYTFNAVELCALDCLDGRDAVLFCDAKSLPIVVEAVSKLDAFGGGIPREIPGLRPGGLLRAREPSNK